MTEKQEGKKEEFSSNDFYEQHKPALDVEGNMAEGWPFMLNKNTEAFANAFYFSQNELKKEVVEDKKSRNFFFAALAELEAEAEKSEELKKPLEYYYEKILELWDKVPEQEKHPKVLEIERRFQLEVTKQRVINKYVLDPDKVYGSAVFACCKIESNGLAFGVFLAKEEPVLDKKGSVVGITQVQKPVLISDQHFIYEVDQHFQNTHKIVFESIPGRMQLRWSLPNIKKFLTGKVENVNKAELFQKIRDHYEKYIYFHEERWYDVHALWDMGTYFHQLFFAYPIFELRGMHGTGKSTIMKVSGYLTLNATPTMINPSEAILFRETHDKRPTKYIDEAEKLFTIVKGGKVEGDNRVELINSSYEAGAAVPRIEKDGDKWVSRYYQTYSPTMVSSINGLYGATEDRAIVHTTTRAPAQDPRSGLDPEHDKNSPAWQEIRDDLYVFTLQNWREVEEIYRSGELAKEAGLRNRDLKIWLPLLALAKYISPELFKVMITFAKHITAIKQDDSISEGTLDYKLLKVFYGMLTEASKKVYIKDIRARYLVETGEENIAFKTISARLDKLGLREFRAKDWKGSHYILAQPVFAQIITPLFPELITEFINKNSSDSSDSSGLIYNNVMNNIVEEKLADESLTNNTLFQKKLADESDGNDESDGASLDDQGQKNTNFRPRKERLLDFILAKDAGQGTPFEALVAAGFEATWAGKMLAELASRGSVWEPRPGFWKVLQ